MQSPEVRSEHRGQSTHCPDARAQLSARSAESSYAGSIQGALGMEEQYTQPRHTD